MSSLEVQDELRVTDSASNPLHRRKPNKRRSPKSGAKPEIGPIIRDEIALLGLLVLFIGIVSTDHYYQQFGLRYQFLGLPSFHIAYRGLTAMMSEPSLIVPALIGALWLNSDMVLKSSKLSRFRGFRVPIRYLLLLFTIAASYPLAARAGMRLALLDYQENTCRMPMVEIDTPTGPVEPENGGYYRLLNADANYVMVFAPLQDGEIASAPNIRFFRKEEVSGGTIIQHP